MNSLPMPKDFGLPEKYESWRQNQDSGVMHSLSAEKRFVMSVCPTGFGKSLMYMAHALLKGGRTLILTSTKGLQSQLVRDFGDLICDIRGRNAYRCRLEGNETTCDYGPCIAGVHCKLRDSSCLYYKAFQRAKRANIAVTNYAYWMTSCEYGEALFASDSKFTTLVCDEAHDVPDLVASFLTVNLNVSDEVMRTVVPHDKPTTVAGWAVWAERRYDEVQKWEQDLKEDLREGSPSIRERRKLVKLGRLLKSMDRMATMDDEWVMDATGDLYSFSPIWPRAQCEEVLFKGIPHIVFTSASVCAKTLEYLGIPMEEIDSVEYPHTFPVANRRLYHIPTIRLNFRSTPGDIKKWVIRIDQVVGARRDRKGIVHTVSYARRDRVMTESRHRDIMVSHKRGNVIDMVRMFKESDPPLVLVSPTMVTGWDFPGPECEFQIIGKLAFPDTRNQIVKARAQQDPDYAPYVAMQKLIQECGRGNRFESDRCENFIIDDNVVWFMPKYAHFAASWFRETFQRVKTIPRPAEKLNGKGG